MRVQTKNSKILLQFVKYCVKHHKYKKALNILDHALVIDGKNPKLWLSKIKVLQRMNCSFDAELVYQEAERNNVQFVDDIGYLSTFQNREKIRNILGNIYFK